MPGCAPRKTAERRWRRDHGHIYALDQAAMTGVSVRTPGVHTAAKNVSHRHRTLQLPQPKSEAKPAQQISSSRPLPKKAVAQPNRTTTVRSSTTRRSTNERHTEGTLPDGREQHDPPDAGTEHGRSSQPLPMPSWPSRSIKIARRRPEALSSVLDPTSSRRTVDDSCPGSADLHRSRDHRSPPSDRQTPVRVPADISITRSRTFDYDAAAGVDRKLIEELATCRHSQTATNVQLIGPPGVGKTHPSVGLARAASHASNRTYFITAADLRCPAGASTMSW